MTAHRQSLLLRAGAVAVLATGALIGVAMPAFAATPAATLSAGSFEMNAGDTKTLQVKLSGGPATGQTLTVDAPSINGQITIKTSESGCDGSGGTSITCGGIAIPDGSDKVLTFQLVAKTPSGLQTGQNLNGTGNVTLAGSAGPSFTVNVHGPAAAPATTPATPTVTEVSGTVTDSTTSKAIKDATVVMADGSGKNRQAQTDTFGKFKFTGSADSPIAPGTINISASKDAYDNATTSKDAAAGKALTGIKFPLVPLNATATPQDPLTTTGAAAPPTQATNGAAEPGGINPTNTSGNGGGSTFSWVLIALGALLVLFGIGAIVLLLRRRGDDGDDEDDDVPPPPRRGPGGGQRPGYRAPQADPTMIAPVMTGRGNANDATAIVRNPRIDDDPYGAPPRSGYPATAPAGPGYGPSSGGGYGGGGYDDQAGYGAGPGGGSYGAGPGTGYGPSSRPAVDGYGASEYANGGYGADQGGYGAAPAAGGYEQRGGYGEDPPTHRYEPSGAAGGYGAGAPQNDGGYGAATQPGGGYGAGAAHDGYGPAAGGPPGDGYSPGSQQNGGYSPSAGNGYGPQADYDGPYAGRGGYEQRGGYEPAAGYERDGYERVPEPPRAGNGYEQPGGGGYDDRGGYYGDGNGAPPSRPAPPSRSDRRSLDWLDD